MLSVLVFNNCNISRLIERTATLLDIGYNYFQAVTAPAPNNGVMAAIVGQMATDGVQWDELKICGMYLVPVDFLVQNRLIEYLIYISKPSHNPKILGS